MLLSAVAEAACVGDCHDDGAVTVDELVVGVNIALGQAAVETCTALDRNGDGAVTVDELVAAVNNALSGCPAEETPTPTPTGGPNPTPTSGGEGLGRRMFSIQPGTSRFSIKGLPLPLETTDVEGFLELEAGAVDPETGLRPIRVTDASEFISIWLVPPIGLPSAICIKPVIDSFPVEDAGQLACDGDDRAGVIITQDHNINDIDPACETGFPDINPLHQGVCNSDYLSEIIPGDSGPGGMVIAPDPETRQGGLSMESFVETALPCGDEPGTSRGVDQWVLTTGLVRGRVVDVDNVPGETMEFEAQGQNVSCDAWTEEDGPGTLVFVGPNVDQELTGLGLIDVVYVFVLDD